MTRSRFAAAAARAGRLGGPRRSGFVYVVRGDHPVGGLSSWCVRATALLCVNGAVPRGYAVDVDCLGQGYDGLLNVVAQQQGRSLVVVDSYQTLGPFLGQLVDRADLLSICPRVAWGLRDGEPAPMSGGAGAQIVWRSEGELGPSPERVRAAIGKVADRHANAKGGLWFPIS